MANSLISMIKGNSTLINNTEVLNGQVLFDTDKKAILLDDNNTRSEYCGADKSNKNLAPIENGNTATRGYSAGSYVVWKEQLYKVLTQINSGTTFSVGTNIVADTAGAELTQISADTSWYGTSSTAAGTTAKIATTTDSKFTLVTGAKVRIKFTYANTASAPTLNVDSKGAKNIKAYGTTAPTVWWKAGDVVDFTYDGTNFIMGSTQGEIEQINNDLHKGSVSVTAQSGETLAHLLNRLAQLIDFSKVSLSSHLVLFFGVILTTPYIAPNGISFVGFYNNGVQQLQFELIDVFNGSSKWVRALSTNIGNIADISNEIAPSGTITLYY